MESAREMAPLSFAALLKRYRRAAGLSQEALAERAGYSVGHISKLEGGTRLPSPATAELLSDALDLSETERSVFLRAARQRGLSVQLPDTNDHHAPHLVNRETELALLETTLTEIDAPALLLFAGHPGIGKSQLLSAAAQGARRAGWMVLQGTSHRFGADFPYAPVQGAIAACLQGMSSAQAREALKGCSWLALLLPELVEAGILPAPPSNVPPDQVRRLAFIAVRRFLSNIAGVSGTALVLDNLESSSADAIALMGSLLHNGNGLPLRIIGACRLVALQPGTALTGLIADLTQSSMVLVQTVEPLTLPASRQLMNSQLAEFVSPEAVGPAVKDELLRRAGGIPLVIVSYSKAVGGGPDHELPASVPAAVLEAVRLGMGAISQVARQVAQVVSVAGGPIPRAAVVMVAGKLGASEQAVVQALDSGCSANLLLERPDDTYEFLSDALAEAIEGELGNAQRAYLHREIANALARLNPQGHEAALAAHYLQAGNIDLATSYLGSAGQKAQACTAYAESARYFAELAQQYEARGQSYEAARTREHLGIVLGLLGQQEDALRVLDCARQGYRVLGDREGQGRVAALISTVDADSRPPREALAHVEDEAAAATAERLPLREQALISLALARAYRRLGRYAEALRSVEHAAELARGAQDQALVMVGELERGAMLDKQRSADAGLHVLETVVLPFAAKHDDPWLEYQALSHDIRDHIFRGNFAQAQRATVRLCEIANALADPQIRAKGDLATGVVQFYRGVWATAQQELLRAESALRRQGRMRPAAAANAWLTRLFVARGSWNEATWCFERLESIATDEGDPGLCWRATYARAERALLARRFDDALAILEPFLSALGKRDIEMCEAQSLLAWGHAERGDFETAESLMTQSIQQLTTAGATCSLLEAQCIEARIQMWQGRLPLALATLYDVRERSRELPYPYVEAKALYLRGQVHALSNESQPASDALSEALEICVRMGEQLYAEQIERALVQSRPSAKQAPGLVRS